MARPIIGRCSQSWLLLLLVIIMVLAPAQALANSGPPRYQGDTGGLLLPGKSEQVHVLGEQLRFELSPGLSSAQVSARYTLSNQGGPLSAQPFIFVIQSTDHGAKELELGVTWRGEPVAVVEIPWDGFTAEQLAAMEREWTSVDLLVDPITGEPYGEEHFFGGAGLRYARFELDLPAGVEGELEVTYRHRAAYDRVRYVNQVYHYQYLLLPARGWASFGPLEIEVDAPKGQRYYFASNLSFQPQEGRYRAEFPGLPDENLAFSVMDKSGVIAGLVDSRAPYYWMGFGLLLLLGAGLGYLLGQVGGRVPVRGWWRTASLLGLLFLGALLDLGLAGLVLGLFPVLRANLLGLLFIGVGQGICTAVLTGVILIRVAARVARARGASDPVSG